jgi:hypothetical protein
MRYLYHVKCKVVNNDDDERGGVSLLNCQKGVV